MKAHHRLTVLCFWLLWNCATLSAQNHPVRATLQVTPPYPVYLSDYVAPGEDKLTFTLLFNDFAEPSYQVRLRLSIEGSGGIRLDTRPGLPLPVFTVQPGIPLVLKGDELSAYFNPDNLLFTGLTREQYGKQGGLPGGYYRFCLQAVDMRRPDLSLSNPACASAWLQLSSPPRLNLPLCGAKMPYEEVQNLSFTWTPLHLSSPSASRESEYVFSLWEIRQEGRDANEVVGASRPIYQVVTEQASLYYGPSQPPLVPGLQYVWRVQVRDRQGKNYFENEGYSQICTFTYGHLPPLGIPGKLSATAQTQSKARVSWEGVNGATGYELEYRPKGGSEEDWLTEETSGTELEVRDLKPDTEYEYHLKSTEGRRSSAYSETKTIRTPAPRSFTCGTGYPLNPSRSAVPLRTLLPNDEVEVGLFTMKVIQVTSSQNGTFSGTGSMLIPFLHTNMGVYFNNVSINEAFQLVQGQVFAINKGLEGLQQQKQAIANKIVEEKKEQIIEKARAETGFTGEVVAVVGVIASVSKNDAGQVVITNKDGEQQVVTVENGKEVLIQDRKGNQYTVDKDGNVRAGAITSAPVVASNSSNNSSNNAGHPGSITGQGSITEMLVKEALDEFISAINNHQVPSGEPVHKKSKGGPNAAWSGLFEVDLPACLRESSVDVEKIKFSVTTLQQEEALLKLFVKEMLASGTNKTYFEGIEKELNAKVQRQVHRDEKLSELLESGKWQQLKDIVCTYLKNPELDNCALPPCQRGAVTPAGGYVSIPVYGTFASDETNIAYGFDLKTDIYYWNPQQAWFYNTSGKKYEQSWYYWIMDRANKTSHSVVSLTEQETWIGLKTNFMLFGQQAYQDPTGTARKVGQGVVESIKDSYVEFRDASGDEKIAIVWSWNVGVNGAGALRRTVMPISFKGTIGRLIKGGHLLATFENGAIKIRRWIDDNIDVQVPGFDLQVSEVITPDGEKYSGIIRIVKTKDGKFGFKKPTGLIPGKALDHMNALLEKVKAAGAFDANYRKRFEDLKVVISNYQKQTFKIGDHTIELDHQAIAHIFGRHHPKYFIDVSSPVQSFFPDNMSIYDLIGLFRKIETSVYKNKEVFQKFDDLLSGRIAKAPNAPAGRGQLHLLIDNQLYTFGFNSYHPYQFYSVSSNAADYSEKLMKAIKIN